MADKIRVTVKEKILIHLLNYSKYRDQFEVPSQISQEGMANVIGVRRSHIASALKDLRENALVEEQKARTLGEVRRKNAYFLTHEGEGEALRLKEALMQKNISLRTEDGILKELKISEVNKELKEKLDILEILNRLSEDRVLDVRAKVQEEEVPDMVKEAEFIVTCPFCGSINHNPNLGQLQIQGDENEFLISCMFCGNNFLAVKTDIPNQLMAKGYAMQPPPQEVLQTKYFRPVGPAHAANTFLVSLGLFLMLASFTLALLVFQDYLPDNFFVLVLVGFAMSLTLLYIGLIDVRHLDVITRRILIVTGAVFASFVALFLGLMSGAEYDEEQAGIMASIVFPAFGVFIFGKPLARSLRSELSLSLGVFLILFGVFSIVFYYMLSWQVSFSPFWVISGGAMIITSFEIERLEKNLIWRGLCLGVGFFIIVFSIMVVNSNYSKLNTWKMIGLVLWMLLGVFLVLIRFLKKEFRKKVFDSLKSALLSGLGVLFILLGILLAKNEKYMECAVEFFIGIPIIWYGLAKIKKIEPLQVGVIAFIIALEVFTVLSLIIS